MMGVTPRQRDGKGKFCYSCFLSEYFRTAFCCPADLLREHLCCLSPHPTQADPSSPHPHSLPNAALLSPFLWPSTKELLSLGYWLPSRRLSAHFPPRFSPGPSGSKNILPEFLGAPRLKLMLEVAFFIFLKCGGLWEAPFVVLFIACLVVTFKSAF